MFGPRSSALYDLIYDARGRDYEGEAGAIATLVTRYKASAGRALLDVACGTGAHLVLLKRWFEVEGLDLNSEMLKVAGRRLPGVALHCADMVDFDLGCDYDVVLCLFSSIGYAKTSRRFHETVRTLARHTKPGGVVIIEPWFSPDTYSPDTVHLAQVDQPDIKVVRVNLSRLEDGLSVIYFHYLVADKEGVEYFTERHEIGLFSHQEYVEAFRANGLDLIYENHGLSGRGLYIGQQALD